MNLTRILDNLTALTVGVFPMRDRHGYEVAVAIAKLSWQVSPLGDAALTIPQPPLRLASVPTRVIPWSSVQLPSDLVVEKPGTDVLVVGSAHPPAGTDADHHDVSVWVESTRGALRKALRVYGPRHYTQGVLGIRPGVAQRVGITPIEYELAEGGVDESEPGRPLVDTKNPSGRGVAREPLSLLGQSAHQLENLTGASPAGFGPIASSWSPRLERAGRYDEAWRRDRMPLSPVDFDPRHESVAHPELWSETPLDGTEPCELLGMTPSGAWRFKLPLYAPLFEACVHGETRLLETHLDTMLFLPEASRVELVWREPSFSVASPATMPCARRSLA